MNELTCRDLEEMLAAYSADALEPGDRTDVAEHLAECRNHDAALLELRESFAALGAGVTSIDPPIALRASLLEAFDREVVTPASVAPRSAAPAVPTRRGTPFGWFGYALAAALLVVALGLGVWGASRSDSDAIQVLRTQSEAGSLQLTYLPEHDVGVLDVDLPLLGESQSYQAWRIHADGTAGSLGVLPASQGRFALAGNLRGATAVALSVEPFGGSDVPTSDPILVTPLP